MWRPGLGDLAVKDIICILTGGIEGLEEIVFSDYLVGKAKIRIFTGKVGFVNIDSGGISLVRVGKF